MGFWYPSGGAFRQRKKQNIEAWQQTISAGRCEVLYRVMDSIREGQWQCFVSLLCNQAGWAVVESEGVYSSGSRCGVSLCMAEMGAAEGKGVVEDWQRTKAKEAMPKS
jgi:hypothetical protein